jgi:hypothetical protein
MVIDDSYNGQNDSNGGNPQQMWRMKGETTEIVDVFAGVLTGPQKTGHPEK